MTVNQLWQAYHDSKTDETRWALVERLRPVVRRIAISLHKKHPAANVDELESDGLFGILEAADRYNPDRSAAFQSYASHRIRGRMLDHIRREVQGGLTGVARRKNPILEQVSDDSKSHHSNGKAFRAVDAMLDSAKYIERLPCPVDRLLLTLAFIDGMSRETMGDICTDWDRSTINCRIHQATMRLRSIVRDHSTA